MRRGARNPDGQLSLPGVGALPAKLRRPKGVYGGSAHSRLVTALVRWSEHSSVASRIVLNRSPSGLFVLRHGGAALAARKGTSDLTGRAGSRFVAVEVKVGRDRLRPDQRAYLAGVIRDGGWAFVCRDSVEDFAASFAAAERGAYAPPAELLAPAAPTR